MCGRFTLTGTQAEIAAYFAAKMSPAGDDGKPLWDWTPHYNIAPTTVIPIVAFDGGKARKIVPMRWGLHSHWKKGPPEGRPLFNARIETAADKPSFRTPWRRRRALIPASGWYEWLADVDNPKAKKTPYYIYASRGSQAGNGFSAFAGLWDQWRVNEGVTLLSCTILTTAAQGELKHLHHRMPVRLTENQFDRWLDWDEKADWLLDDHMGASQLDYHQVGRAVGSNKAQGAELIIPAAFTA